MLKQKCQEMAKLADFESSKRMDLERQLNQVQTASVHG